MEEMGLDKVFNKTIRALPLPNFAEEGIILVKDFFKEADNREKIWDVFENLFNKNGNIIKDIWNVKETIKDKGLKEGISEAFDTVISNARSSKTISSKTANMLQDGKTIIVDKIINDKSNFLGQEKLLNQINNKFNKWEEAIQKNDFKEIEVLGNQIKDNSKGLMPTIELLRKIENIDNTINLYKNKTIEGGSQITELEKEILSKIA